MKNMCEFVHKYVEEWVLVWKSVRERQQGLAEVRLPILWSGPNFVERHALDHRQFTLERVKGIEPSYEAWEAAVLPLNYTRVASILRAFRTV